jgi:anthranilate 1,2-dioxygenase large subunit/terephthalate 1,2-dioxygenase oxygenase component alpha subunit
MQRDGVTAFQDGSPQPWDESDIASVPYWVYQRPEVLAREHEQVFRGRTWNFLCLAAEVATPGRFRTCRMGDMPVVVSRDGQGLLHAFENRCAHRGALIVLEDEGQARDFTCVYHAWRYDLSGGLQSIAVEGGVQGKGGMPPGFCRDTIGPRRLRVAEIHGLVFGSLAWDAPPIDEYLGPDVLAKLARVLHKPVEVLGRYTQSLPNNWKLYAENTKDTYHASLLHTFFTTFRITRLTQDGGVTVSPDGAHHASATHHRALQGQEAAYAAQQIRTESDRLQLAAPGFLESVDEFGDGVVVQILSVFPGFVLQQIHNCLAVRQIVPEGVERTSLHWTFIGFADDTPALRQMRLLQGNLVGPAGYVSMEDGAVGGFVQRGIAAAPDERATILMGGTGCESQGNRATESSVRGFWRAWRALTGY